MKGTVPTDEAWWKKWVRCLVALGVCIPGFILAAIFGLTNVSNAYVLLIFFTTIPTLILGISIFFMADYVNKRLGLLKLDPVVEDEGSFIESKGSKNTHGESVQNETGHAGLLSPENKVADDDQLSESITSNYSL